MPEKPHFRIYQTDLWIFVRPWWWRQLIHMVLCPGAIMWQGPSTYMSQWLLLLSTSNFTNTQLRQNAQRNKGLPKITEECDIFYSAIPLLYLGKFLLISWACPVVPIISFMGIYCTKHTYLVYRYLLSDCSMSDIILGLKVHTYIVSVLWVLKI